MSTEEEETLPYVMNHLPDCFKEKARRELNETPERRITGLKELKEMARDHKLMCDIQFVDDFLVWFLRHRKYDVSRAFKQLVNFVCLMKDHDYLFLSIDNDVFFSDPRRQFLTILPRRCPDGCTIVLYELAKWDPEETSFLEFQKIAAGLWIQSLRDPATQINGYKIIFDFKNTSLKISGYFTPSKIYLLYYASMDCFPGRYKEIHFVSESLLTKAAWSVVKPFMSQKLKQRVILNSSRKDLLDHFPPSVLPVRYGGQLLEEDCLMEWAKDAKKQQEGFTCQGQCNYY